MKIFYLLATVYFSYAVYKNIADKGEHIVSKIIWSSLFLLIILFCVSELLELGIFELPPYWSLAIWVAFGCLFEYGVLYYYKRRNDKWISAEYYIIKASELLSQPDLFEYRRKSLEEKDSSKWKKEILDAMIALEELANEKGASSDFWRLMENAALALGKKEKVKLYSKTFHEKLCVSPHKTPNTLKE
ncbi:hypothetical protein [Pleionea sp. CnH1-48]|uniref:hypothetical protein n=1 Tax=Pleionea sp. CnH1-48 TaxID=2954494 RepID=UPI002096ECB8|nr:hypothetical protein [Pleionea sp. CnH1-48]MCO7225985.1 hypothetical protein [Pleionea sp. CnH1-48]